MKKKIITAILAISCVGLSVSSAFSASYIDCKSVSIVSVGSGVPTASSLYVNLKNESGAACGDLANGATLQYVLNTTNTDRTYATLLTAVSMQKKLWVRLAGTGSQNSLLLVVSLLN